MGSSFFTNFAIRMHQSSCIADTATDWLGTFTKPVFPEKVDLLYLLKLSLQSSTTSQDDVRLLQICMQEVLEFLRTCQYTVNSGTWTYPRDATKQGCLFASVDTDLFDDMQVLRNSYKGCPAYLQ